MPAADWDDMPVGLARTWVTRYNRLLFLVVTLREFVRKGWPSGCLPDLVTDAVWEAVDAADHLRAHGYAPHLRAAGDEAALWARTVEYACALPPRTPPAGATVGEVAAWAGRMQAAWSRYAAFVGELPDDCFARVQALGPGAYSPEGLAGVVGPGGRRPAAEGHNQPGDKCLDPLITRGEG
jgi:hypothetical protein